MRIIKRMQMILLLLVVGFVVIGCDEKDPPKKDVLPTKVVVSGLKDLKVDESVTLKATVTPTNATNKNVSWSVDNDTLATITPNGSNCTVKALKEGKVKITVKCTADELVTEVLEINITKEVIIEPVKAESIELSGEEEVFLSKEITLTANVLPVDAADKKVVWSSSDESIATVKDGVVTPVAVGVVTITCTLESDSNIKASKEITVKEEVIVIKTTAITIKGNDSVIEGKEITLSVEYEPSDATDVGVNWSSSDETIATIENGVLKGIKAGTVTVTATLIADNTISNTFDVIVNPYVMLESFTITAETLEVKVSERISLNIVTVPENATDKDVEWSVSDDKIAEVDKFGKVIGKSIGEVVVTAISKINPELKNEVKVTVKSFEEIMPTSISIDGVKSMYVGSTIRLTAIVYPEGVAQSVTWSVRDEKKGKIDQIGNLTAVSEGSIRVKATSTINGLESSWFVVSAEPAPIIEDYPDMMGYEITIYEDEVTIPTVDPFNDGYRAKDKMMKQAAWNETQTNFNCTIKYIKYPSDAPWGPTRISWINTAASSQSATADFYTISAQWLPGFVNGGAVVDVDDYFKRYGNNQIEPAIRQASTYKGKLYSVSTGLTQGRTYIINGLFYNVGLLEQYNIESPAKMFNEGKWTYNDFVDWALAAQAKLGSEKWVCSGAPQMYWSGMVQAGGVRIADTSTLRLNVKHQYSYDAIDALKKIVKGGAWDVDGIDYDEKVVSFQTGNAIMQVGQYWFVKHSMRFSSDMWGEDTRFGYVPFPYPNTVTKENSRVNLVDESILVMANGRSNAYPAGSSFTYKDVYRALLEMFLKTAEKVTEAANNGTIDFEQIKQDSISAIIDDPESVTATVYYTSEKTIYDPIFDGVSLSYSGNPAVAVMNIVVQDLDAEATFDSFIDEVTSQLISVYG